jgi:hypothetical protein
MPEPLEQRLRGLKPLAPPAESWMRIQRRYRREKRAGQLRRWLPLAAAAGLALVVLRTPQPDQAPASAEPVVAAPVEVHRLQRRSAELEAALAALPRRPATRSAAAGAAIGLYQDQIALIDARLNRAGVSRHAEPLWRERVELMDGLVRARYIEAGAQSY